MWICAVMPCKNVTVEVLDQRSTLLQLDRILLDE